MSALAPHRESRRGEGGTFGRRRMSTRPTAHAQRAAF